MFDFYFFGNIRLYFRSFLRYSKLFYKVKRKVRYPREYEASQLDWHPTEALILYHLFNM